MKPVDIKELEQAIRYTMETNPHLLLALREPTTAVAYALTRDIEARTLLALIQEVRALRAVANATVRRLESGGIETGYPDDALLDAIDEARRLGLLEEK